MNNIVRISVLLVKASTRVHVAYVNIFQAILCSVLE